MSCTNKAQWLGDDGKKACFQSRQTTLGTQIDNAINALSDGSAFQNYVQRGGVSLNNSNDPSYNAVKTQMENVIQKIQDYENLNKELSTYINNFVSGSNPSEIGTLQQDITNLQKQIKDAKMDYENAKSRQENVEKPRQQVSNYQGLAGKLGFSKPFHKVSIAIFLALGIIFIFLAFMLVREILNKPDASVAMNYNTGNVGMGSIFSNSLLTLVGIVFLFVLLGLFASSGKF